MIEAIIFVPKLIQVTDLQSLINTTSIMKHILNVLKNEIFNQNQTLNELVKKVSISQESYFNDRSNESLFNIWSSQVKELQKTESNLRYLKSAYATICKACEIEPLENEEIVAEKIAKINKRKPREKKNTQPSAD